MWWCQRSLLVAGLIAISSSCASTVGTRADVSRHQTVYAALARQLLDWPGVRGGIFEARSALPGLDSLEFALHLTRLAHERPSIDPVVFTSLRHTARDTSCLPLPSDWRPYGLPLQTECSRAWSTRAVAERVRQSGTSMLSASPIAFSSDGTTAVVLGQILCGRDCFHTALYVFDRTSSGWRVAHVMLIAES